MTIGTRHARSDWLRRACRCCAALVPLALIIQASSAAAAALVPGDPFRQDNLFVRDRLKGRTSLLTVGLGGEQANDTHGGSDVSADGRHIAYWSAASNLVRGDTNGEADIFVRDRASR